MKQKRSRYNTINLLIANSILIIQLKVLYPLPFVVKHNSQAEHFVNELYGKVASSLWHWYHAQFPKRKWQKGGKLTKHFLDFCKNWNGSCFSPIY